jgi:D-alanyl-D-alanine carboxypeptidase
MFARIPPLEPFISWIPLSVSWRKALLLRRHAVYEGIARLPCKSRQNPLRPFGLANACPKRQSQSRILVIGRFRLFWTIQLRIQRVFKTSSCRAVDAIAAKCVSDGKTPGIAIGIMQNGKAVLEEGYGTANLEHKVPAKPETVFRIASITKQFTATGILLLAEEHLLSTNDKLSRFFPEFPRSDEVTIRQLLTHTSGLPSYDAKPEYRSFRLQSHTISELVNWIKPDPYVAEPGAQYFYSNSGYLLLAGIIEKVSGESFRDFLKARVFDRLGLTGTQVVQDDATLVPNRAAGYVLRDGQFGQFLNAPVSAASNNSGGTSVVSTVGDLLRWHSTLFGGMVLSPAIFGEMTSPGTLKNGERIVTPLSESGYGYGLFLINFMGHKKIGHTGRSTAGFNSVAYTYPNERLTIVVLTNIAGEVPLRLLAMQVEEEIASLLLD